MITAVLSLLLADLPNLRSLPGVESVEVVVECKSPRLTIIHVRDWHFVDKQSFALDVRDTSEKPLSDAEIDDLHEDHRTTVAAVQKQQRRLMLSLVKRHGIRRVFHEGLVAEQLPAYKRRIAALKKLKPFLKGDDPLEQFIRHEYETDLLRLGVPGQLLIDGQIEAVLPAEDKAAYEAANPVKPDGRIVFDQKAIEARENAIVRKMLHQSSKVAVVVLGGSHDLSDNIPAGVKLVEVTVRTYPE